VLLPEPGGYPGTHASSGIARPFVGLANPIPFLEQLSGLIDKPEVHIDATNELEWQLLERFVRQPVRGHAARAAWLDAFARELVGDRAESLLDAWHLVQRARQRIAFMPWTGLLFEHAVMSKRWLNRPFVVNHAELTPDELDYWRPHLFEAGGVREVEDLLNVHATTLLEGKTHARALRTNCFEGNGELRRAAALLEPLGVPELTLQAARLRCLGHFFRCAGNGALFQALVHEASRQPAPPALFNTDRDLLTEVYRDEQANATELAALLDHAPGPLLDLAASAADEDPFTLSTELPRQLRRKAAIMARRWPELERLAPYPNQHPL
jgi:hypothetical protein